MHPKVFMYSRSFTTYIFNEKFIQYYCVSIFQIEIFTTELGKENSIKTCNSPSAINRLLESWKACDQKGGKKPKKPAKSTEASYKKRKTYHCDKKKKESVQTDRKHTSKAIGF